MQFIAHLFDLIISESWNPLPPRKTGGQFYWALLAWRGTKRQAHDHHSPSSIQGEWLAIDVKKKKNILA